MTAVVLTILVFGAAAYAIIARAKAKRQDVPVWSDIPPDIFDDGVFYRPSGGSLVVEANDQAPTNVTIEGKTGSYQVDLRELSCTCPDFQERRSHFVPRDVRRACKHVSMAAGEFFKRAKPTSLAWCFVRPMSYTTTKARYGVRFDTVWIARSGDLEVAVGSSTDSPWMSVVIRDKHDDGVPARYLFQAAERFWTNREPSALHDVERLLESLIGSHHDRP